MITAIARSPGSGSPSQAPSHGGMSCTSNGMPPHEVPSLSNSGWLFASLPKFSGRTFPKYCIMNRGIALTPLLIRRMSNDS
jgi:hypothetical protein